MKNFWAKLFAFLIVFTPFLEPYRIGGVTLDTLSLVASVVIAIIWGRYSLKNRYGSKAFFIYALIVPNIVALASGYGSYLTSSFIVLILYILCQEKIFPALKLDHLLKYYRILVYLTIVVFFVQELMYITMRYRFSALIPFLDVRYDGVSMSSFILNQMYYSRSSAFFLEPSHMAHFLLPYLAISLGQNDKKIEVYKYLGPLIITIVLFFLRSGNGIVGCAFIWMFYVLSVDLALLRKVLFTAFFVIVGIFAFQEMASTDIGQSLMRRTVELEVGGNYNNSGTIRIFRGFYVYGAMYFVQQLFGVGTGGSVQAIEESPYLVMFYDNERYLNNVQMLLVGFGVIGTLLFLGHLLKLYKSNTLSGKLVLIGFLSICFLESFFMTSKMILYFAFAFMFANSRYEIDRIDQIGRG